MHQVEDWITQAEFARRLGISKVALHKAEKCGRVDIEIRNGRPRIEYHSNRRAFIETSNRPERYVQNEVEKRLKHKNKKVNSRNRSESSGNNGFHPVDLIEDPPDKDGDFTHSMNRHQAESVKQVYLAKQAKLKFLKEAGILIETEVVKREWQEIAMRVQKAMLAIPDRVAEIFASTTDADKIHNDLNSEIRHALSSLQYTVKVDAENDRIEEIVEKESSAES